jgi:hypothetical protein
MLTIFRRHKKSCEHRQEGRSYRRCRCPISVEGWRIVISPGIEHVTLLHSVLGLARIELVVDDSKGIGAG